MDIQKTVNGLSLKQLALIAVAIALLILVWQNWDLIVAKAKG
jgi:hypothetical protein